MMYNYSGSSILSYTLYTTTIYTPLYMYSLVYYYRVSLYIYSYY